jgi:hypothetical protein
MSGKFEHIARCMDLQEHDLIEAIDARGKTKALLAHLAAVSSPDTGAAKVLLVLSRMATTACSWIDGDLCVDLLADADTTVIEVATELGGGLRERLLSPMSFRAPIAEFVRAIDRVPHLVAPLSIRAKSPRRVSLTATEALRRTTLPPPPIEIASDSLFEPAPPPEAPQETNAVTSPSLSPADIDAGWD